MTEVRFYHLETKLLDEALPEILAKVLEQGKRAVVRVVDEKEADRLSAKLWTWRPDAFLPHGTEVDGHAPDQPIWITDKEENPNEADILILANGSGSHRVADYTLCCEMLDGRNVSEVDAARSRWQSYKTQGFDVTYWQQDNNGRWLKKA